MQELTEQEREELMECEFVVKGNWDGGPYTTPGKLVDIDSSIGITIVNKDDHEDYLQCLQGPGISMKNVEEWAKDPGLYDALFQGIVQGIKDGVVDLTNHTIEEDYHKTSAKGPTADDCAFNR